MKNTKIDYKIMCIYLLPILLLIFLVNICISQNTYYKVYQNNFKYKYNYNVSKADSIDDNFLLTFDTKYNDDEFVIEYENNIDDIGVSPSSVNR